MLILENNHPPMKKLTQPWKLCRSFGSQPVGNVAGPRWPEAGIAAQVIPSQSSRRTLRGKVDTHCRPADLPTCRPADLPTCRPADLPTCRLESRRAPDASTSFNSDVGSFDASFLSGATTARSRDSNSLDVSSDTTVPHRSSDLTNTIIISEELNNFNICPKCIRR